MAPPFLYRECGLDGIGCSERKGRAGKPARLTRFGVAASCQAKHTAFGAGTSWLLTTTSPRSLASYGRYRNGTPIRKWLCHQEIALGAAS